MWRSCWRNLQHYVLNASFQIIFSGRLLLLVNKHFILHKAAQVKKSHAFRSTGIGVETSEETVVLRRESPERTRSQSVEFFVTWSFALWFSSSHMLFRNLTGVQALESECVLHIAVGVFYLCKLVSMNHSCTHRTYQTQHHTTLRRSSWTFLKNRLAETAFILAEMIPP
jgi:hypothetical protein